MERNLEKSNKKSNSKSNNLKKISGAALVSAMILTGVNNAQATDLKNASSQKQAIELLKSQGKILPNVATDYLHYGIFYRTNNLYVYHSYPYAEHRQRYEADNLKNVDGKNIEIQNDIDSCNFLNETVYKANLERIVPIIIDTQIDTVRGATSEYERVDRVNSKDFTGSGVVIDGGKSTHMNAMADVLIAKKDNFTMEDYDKGIERRMAREDVGMRPGKARLCVWSPNGGGNVEVAKSFEYICNEAESYPDKKYILSCSRTGGFALGVDDPNYKLWTKLGNMDNVIIFVARSDPLSNSTDTYAAHPSTIEVGHVYTPDMKVVDQTTQKLSFAGEQKDRVVPNPGFQQTGKMHGDGFCALGEYTTSQSTAFMTGIAANLWAQNPNWTKDDVIAMMKRDAYKPMPGTMDAVQSHQDGNGGVVIDSTYKSEVKYDANGWNEWFGYGIVQPGKTMKENIFPEIKKKLSAKDGKYYFTVSNFPAEYNIVGEGVSKDEKGYFVDLTQLNPGKHKVTFVGKCDYQGKIYDFPIDRSFEVVGLPASPSIIGISGHRKRLNTDQKQVYFENLKGQITNYQPGYTVNLIFNDGTIIENVVVDAQGKFDLTNTSSSPIDYKFGDPDMKMSIEFVDSDGNKNSSDIILTSDLVTDAQDILSNGGLDEVKIYPNPVQDILNIDIPSDIQLNVKIFTTLGQLYSASDLTRNNNQLDLSSLKPAIYFVTIMDSKGNKRTEKIIKR